MPKIPVKGSYLMPRSMCSWMPNPKFPKWWRRYPCLKSSSSSTRGPSPSDHALGSRRPCPRGQSRALRSFRFSWCRSCGRCSGLWRGLVFDRRDPRAPWRLSGEGLTLGELVAGLTHTDVEHQLLDSDLAHGVFLLGLGLLGDLLGHWIIILD